MGLGIVGHFQRLEPWPFTLWRFTVCVPFAHTPMLNHGVQRPLERTLISVCIQVLEGVKAFQEGTRVSNLVALT
jgi:hypothetical protein